MIKSFLIRFIAFVLLLTLSLNLLVFIKISDLVFYPLKEIVATPKSWGLNYEDINIELENKNKIHGWYVPHPQATKTILFFHGNGGNISHRRESLMIFHQLKLNTLIVDYAGYGNSEGTASEKSVYHSAQAAWNYLTNVKNISAKNIIIFGRSLGGAVAVELAVKVKPAALIIESTFSSLRDMADISFPVMSNFIYLPYRFDSFNKIKNFTAPVLSIHSPDDEIIPYILGEKLYKSIKSKKEFLKITGGHNDGFIRSITPYKQTLNRFIQSI